MADNDNTGMPDWNKLSGSDKMESSNEGQLDVTQDDVDFVRRKLNEKMGGLGKIQKPTSPPDNGDPSP
ncbi:MAG: hypothetical protein ACRBDI_03415 [Alphaproteobacteria bacterium]